MRMHRLSFDFLEQPTPCHAKSVVSDPLLPSVRACLQPSSSASATLRATPAPFFRPLFLSCPSRRRPPPPPPPPQLDVGTPVYLAKSHENDFMEKDVVFVSDALIRKYEAVEFRPQAGDMLIWHPKTIHMVQGPRGGWGDRKRRVLGGTAAIDDCTYEENMVRRPARPRRLGPHPPPPRQRPGRLGLPLFPAAGFREVVVGVRRGRGAWPGVGPPGGLAGCRAPRV